MPGLIIAGLLAALEDPNARKALVSLFGDILLYVEHRRSADPQMLAQSDAAWAKLMAATTSEEVLNAHQAIQALQARPGA